MLARRAALRYPLFSFDFRLVLAHRPSPPTDGKDDDDSVCENSSKRSEDIQKNGSGVVRLCLRSYDIESKPVTPAPVLPMSSKLSVARLVDSDARPKTTPNPIPAYGVMQSLSANPNEEEIRNKVSPTASPKREQNEKKDQTEKGAVKGK